MLQPIHLIVKLFRPYRLSIRNINVNYQDAATNPGYEPSLIIFKAFHSFGDLGWCFFG